MIPVEEGRRLLPWLAIALGTVLALGGGGFAMVGVDYSWTFYWVGFSALIVGVVLIVAGCENLA